MKRPKLVELTWLDHCEPAGLNVWWDREQVEKAEPAVIRSVGWIIKETDTYVVMVAQLAEDGMTGQPLVVISSCVTKRRNL